MIYDKVLCIGDSMTFGARSYFGYPEYLAKYLREKTRKYWICVNAGVNRERAVDVLRRCDRVLREFEDIMAVTIFVGTNDCKINSFTSPDLYEEALRQMIAKIHASGKISFVMKIPDIVYSGCFPYCLGSREQVKKLNKRVEKVAKEEGCYLIDITGLDEDCYCIDKLHFSEVGCIKVAEIVGNAILHRK